MHRIHHVARIHHAKARQAGQPGQAGRHVTTGSGPRPAARARTTASPGHRPPSPSSATREHASPQTATDNAQGRAEAWRPGQANPSIYSLVFYTVFEEAAAKVTGVARGGG